MAFDVIVIKIASWRRLYWPNHPRVQSGFYNTIQLLVYYMYHY